MQSKNRKCLRNILQKKQIPKSLDKKFVDGILCTALGADNGIRNNKERQAFRIFLSKQWRSIVEGEERDPRVLLAQSTFAAFSELKDGHSILETYISGKVLKKDVKMLYEKVNECKMKKDQFLKYRTRIQSTIFIDALKEEVQFTLRYSMEVGCHVDNIVCDDY